MNLCFTLGVYIDPDNRDDPNMILRAWPMSLGKSVTLLGAALLAASNFASRGEDPDASAADAAVPAPSESANSRPPKVEAFALIGTASYPGGASAFFDGNSAEFKTSIHPGEKVGGCILEAVAFDHVRLRAGAREINLPMKMQLRRENQGPWQLLALTGRFTPADPPAAPQARPGAPPAVTPPPVENRATTELDFGLSEKQLRNLDKLADGAMMPGKEFKPEKQDAEAKLIRKMEEALQREQ